MAKRIQHSRFVGDDLVWLPDNEVIVEYSDPVSREEHRDEMLELGFKVVSESSTLGVERCLTWYRFGEQPQDSKP